MQSTAKVCPCCRLERMNGRTEWRTSFGPFARQQTTKYNLVVKSFALTPPANLFTATAGARRNWHPPLHGRRCSSPPSKLVQVRQLPFASRSFSSCRRKVGVLFSCIMHQKCWHCNEGAINYFTYLPFRELVLWFTRFCLARYEHKWAWAWHYNGAHAVHSFFMCRTECLLTPQHGTDQLTAPPNPPICSSPSPLIYVCKWRQVIRT